MSGAVANMAVMMGAMQVAKRIPFEEEPQYVLYARIAYVTAQVLCLLVNYFISLKVSNGERTIRAFIDVCCHSGTACAD